MNSLFNPSKMVKKTIFAIAIAASLVVSVAAQKVEPQSQGKMYGDPGFRGEPINLNVVNADIREILSYITDQYGINFVIDRSVKDVPVTVKVNDVPWNVALDSILQSQGLAAQVNGNIIRIADAGTLASEGEVFRTRVNNQLDNSALYTEFVRLNYARAYGTLQGDAGGANQTTTGTASAGGASSSTMGGPSAMGGGGGGVSGTNSDQGILGIVKKRLSRRGTVEVDGRTNTLIITDVRQNIDAIKQLISLLDQPEPQVEIEARIVVATRNFSRDIGVQLFAMINGARGSGIQAGSLPPNVTSGGSGTSTGGTTINGLPAGQGLPLTFGNGNLASTIPSTVIGLTTGIFGTAQLSSLISLGEQKGEAKVIATPRVTALNNRSAEIKSGTKIPVTTIQPGSAIGGAAIATTTYIDVPLRLAITPQITDLGTVILNIVAENSSTSTIVGNIAPAINTQSMTTQVTVPDGGTTVVGGVLFDDERNSQDRTPGLGGVPILGNLFKRKGVTRNTNEILFFITPRITRPDVASAPPAPRTTTILQPVPMGNPPSNSGPTVETPTPAVLQGPVTSKPEASPKSPNQQ
jgi:type IV pilus assembly protein PilQ